MVCYECNYDGQPFIFRLKIRTDILITHILKPVFKNLSGYATTYGLFLQEIARIHIAYDSMPCLGNATDDNNNGREL